MWFTYAGSRTYFLRLTSRSSFALSKKSWALSNCTPPTGFQKSSFAT